MILFRPFPCFRWSTVTIIVLYSIARKITRNKNLERIHYLFKSNKSFWREIWWTRTWWYNKCIKCKVSFDNFSWRKSLLAIPAEPKADILIQVITNSLQFSKSRFTSTSTQYSARNEKIDPGYSNSSILEIARKKLLEVCRQI